VLCCGGVQAWRGESEEGGRKGRRGRARNKDGGGVREEVRLKRGYTVRGVLVGERGGRVDEKGRGMKSVSGLPPRAPFLSMLQNLNTGVIKNVAARPKTSSDTVPFFRVEP